MKKSYLVCLALVTVFAACQKTTGDNSSNTSDTITSGKSNTASGKNLKTAATACQESEVLLWEGESFASYTEDKIRGTGVLSFTLEVNDRLDILNEDDSNFGEIVLNEDLTFFALTMPKKVVARKVIATYDFAAFDFDCENVAANRDYFLIYVNKEKRKVKKSDLKYTFSTWQDYIKKQSIKLKSCNLITDQQGNVNQKSKDQFFTIDEIKGDEIKITSSKSCSGEESSFQAMSGNVKWKSDNVLLVDIAVCN
ncbi:hypothetical protein [Flavobacterium anhuiense]|uniref:hypothetical protein n=1 Tax=Flavobacterium anhuiense TaxID=459526 RepID=UPI003D97BEAE